MALSVKYGPIPFTITEIYDANGTYPGVYKKHVDMPGGQLFILPTVFVDVTENAAVCVSNSTSARPYLCHSMLPPPALRVKRLDFVFDRVMYTTL